MTDSNWNQPQGGPDGQGQQRYGQQGYGQQGFDPQGSDLPAYGQQGYGQGAAPGQSGQPGEFGAGQYGAGGFGQPQQPGQPQGQFGSGQTSFGQQGQQPQQGQTGQQPPQGLPGQQQPQPGQFDQPGQFGQQGQQPQPGQFGQQGQFGQPDQFGQQGQQGQFGQQPQQGQFGQQAPPRPKPQPVQGSKLDWLRDIGGPALVLVALVMVWSIDADRRGGLALTAVSIAPLITAIIAVLGGVFQIIARFGLVPLSPQLTHYIRAGAQVPLIVTAVVYAVIDFVAAIETWGELSGAGLPVAGLGGGAAIALAGAMLIQQPRDYELRALGGLQSQSGRVMALVNRILVILFGALVAISLLVWIVTRIVWLSRFEAFGGIVFVLAVVVFVAAFIGLPVTLLILGSQPGRLLMIAVGAAASIALLLDGVFGLSFSIIGVEMSSLVFPLTLVFAAPLGALAISPDIAVNRKPMHPVAGWFSAGGVGMLVVAAAALSMVIAAIYAFLPQDGFDGLEGGRLVLTILILILSIVVAAGAVYGYLLLRGPQVTASQQTLVIISGGIALLGLLVTIFCLIEQRMDRIDSASTLPAIYPFAALFLLPLLLLIGFVAAKDLRGHFQQTGTAMKLSGAGAGAGAGQQGFQQQTYGGVPPQGLGPDADQQGYGQSAPGQQFSGQQFTGQQAFGQAGVGESAGQPTGQQAFGQPSFGGSADQPTAQQGFGERGVGQPSDQQYTGQQNYAPQSGEYRANGQRSGGQFGQQLGQPEFTQPSTGQSSGVQDHGHQSSAQQPGQQNFGQQDTGQQHGAPQGFGQQFDQQRSGQVGFGQAGQQGSGANVQQDSGAESPQHNFGPGSSAAGAPATGLGAETTEQDSPRSPFGSESQKQASRPSTAGSSNTDATEGNAAEAGTTQASATDEAQASDVDLAAAARTALNPETPSSELEWMKDHRELWPYLASAPSASKELLDWLARTEDETVLAYLKNRGYQA